MKAISAAIAAAAIMVAGAANASVTYVLDADDAGFQLTLPSYVTSYQNFPAAALDSCTPLPNLVCDSVDISPANGGFDALYLNMLSTTPGLNGAILAWGFTIGALSQDGVHLASNSVDNATLTVTSSAAVPEPATWALMLLGFGALGGALRRRRAWAHT
jgi:hypothetical protein